MVIITTEQQTENKVAKSMAATTNWNTSSYNGAIGNNLSLNNKSGFSGLPVGSRYLYGGFIDFTGWWSSTEDTDASWYRHLGYNYSGIGRDRTNKELGYSVRCVKD
jgi:uncharacterized protein (TIGR02145 family)